MIPRTLYFYFTKQILKSFIIVSLSFYIILIVLQIIDLLTRLDADMTVILTMSINRVTTTFYNMMPMSSLLSFMLAFNTMNKNNEIVISRSSGLSMVQFFAPAVVFGLVIGIFYTAILQPLAINGMEIYQKLWNQSEKQQHTTIEISNTGLWLRESPEADKQRIINSQKLSEQTITFYDNEIILFEKGKNQTTVFRADEMKLADKKWLLKNVTKFNQAKIQKFDYLELNTAISKDYIKKLLSSVEKITFWDLNNYIKQLKKSKLNANEGIVRFNFLLSMPLLFVAIVFVAGFFTAQPTVRNSNKKNIRNGIIAGFGLYFYVNSAKFLVFISNIDPLILGWAPTITMLFISIFLLFSTDKIRN